MLLRAFEINLIVGVCFLMFEKEDLCQYRCPKSKPNFSDNLDDMLNTNIWSSCKFLSQFKDNRRGTTALWKTILQLSAVESGFQFTIMKTIYCTAYVLKNIYLTSWYYLAHVVKAWIMSISIVVVVDLTLALKTYWLGDTSRVKHNI